MTSFIENSEYNLNSEFNAEGGFENNHHQERPAIKQSIRKVTAKQMKLIEGGLLDLVELSTVSVCGIVKNVNKNNTGVSFTIFDSTGFINCTFWPNPNNPNDRNMGEVVENAFVHVVGTYRNYNDTHGVVCKTIRGATCDRMIHTLISAAYERKVVSSKTINPSPSINYKKNTEMVYEIIKENNSSSGVQVKTICAMLKSEMTESEVRRVVEELCDNSKIYRAGEDIIKLI